MNFVAIFQCDADRASILDDDLLHRTIDSDLSPERSRRTGDGFSDSACAAFGKTPRAERAVNFAHVMMEQNIRGARRTRTEERADDSAGRFCPQQRRSLEPFFDP